MAVSGGTLHGVSLSPFVRKVRAVLGIKGIEYDLVPVMPGAMDPAFLAKSPLSKIPVWEESGDPSEADFVLPDSSAICAYLERAVPEPAVYPTDPRAFGKALFWEEYGDTRIVEATAPPFIQRVVHTKVFKQPCDEEIVRRHIDEILPAVQDQIEELFMASGLANPKDPKVVDLSIWTSFVNLEHAEVELDQDRWPRLGSFVAGMNEHPILGELIEEERRSVASLG